MTTSFAATHREKSIDTAEIRPFVGEDEISITNLWNKCLIRDLITTATFRRKVLLDENFDHDGCNVAVVGDTVVGFSLAIRRRYPYYGVDIEQGKGWITVFFVHPEFRNKGIGKKLLSAAESFLRSHKVHEIYVSSYTPNYFAPGVDLDVYPDAHNFLRSRGYKRSERVYSMGRSLIDFTASPDAETSLASLKSQGIHIQLFEPRYISALIEFLGSNYPGDLLRVGIEKLRRNPTTDEIIIAVKNGQVIGFSHFEEEHFGPFAIDQAFRGRGIGTSLYHVTALQMKEKGQRNLWLAWTTGHAKDFYHNCGLKVTRRLEIMKKVLA